MQLKSTVRFGSSQMAMTVAFIVINSIFEKHGVECVITSINDSSHGQGSLHFKDEAFDVRTKNIPNLALKQTIFKEIKEALPYGFDIIFEHQGGSQEHFHIEYDPK